MRTARAAALGLALVASPALAHASPTVWARARSPEVSERAVLLAEADSYLTRRRKLFHERFQNDLASVGDLYLREARRLLERAGGAASPDPNIRLRLGEVLSELGEPAGCAAALETVTGPEIPAPMRANVFSNLAICYAKVGRRDREIKAYDGALGLETHNASRSTLLANRAEALMATGDLERAILGYREALGMLLTEYERWKFAPTTYWGLGVALDRSGISTPRSSRSGSRATTRMDRQIALELVYSPDYDEAWYAALGHWSRARNATLKAARAEEYGRAMTAWEEYIARAPADDRWLPLARVRMKQCDRERAHPPVGSPKP